MSIRLYEFNVFSRPDYFMGIKYPNGLIRVLRMSDGSPSDAIIKDSRNIKEAEAKRYKKFKCLISNSEPLTTCFNGRMAAKTVYGLGDGMKIVIDHTLCLYTVRMCHMFMELIDEFYKVVTTKSYDERDTLFKIKRITAQFNMLLTLNDYTNINSEMFLSLVDWLKLHKEISKPLVGYNILRTMKLNGFVSPYGKYYIPN